jgi:hypothetical protein
MILKYKNIDTVVWVRMNFLGILFNRRAVFLRCMPAAYAELTAKDAKENAKKTVALLRRGKF